MPFAYYKRLNAAQKKTYRASDAIRAIAIPNVAPLRQLAAAIETALASEKQRAVGDACKALVHALCDRLSIPRPKVTVRKQRPTNDWGELHGLYTWEPGETPTLEVWMRTAANARVVSYRTFLRTLLHEFGHHVDVTHLQFEDSFHTEGFYARESSLMRQLVPAPKKTEEPGVGDGEAPVKAPRKRKPARTAVTDENSAVKKPVQLELF